MDVKCPNCGSENTQAIQIMMQAGSQTGAMQTASMNWSQGGGVGVGGALSAIQLQSQFAAKYRLPERPAKGSGALVGGLILLAFFAAGSLANLGIQSFGFWIFLALLLFGGIALIASYSKPNQHLIRRQKDWADRREYLGRAWVCHRCGTDWIPSP